MTRYLSTTGQDPDRQFSCLYRGVVVQRQGDKIRARVPQVLGNELTNWARPITTVGSTAPAPGTSITVAFYGGDINFPLYSPSAGSETWHSIIPAANWISSASYQYVGIGTGKIGFAGTITTPSTGSYTGITFNSPLPLTYRPTTVRRWGVINVSNNTMTGFGVLFTDGTMQFQGLPASYNNMVVEITGEVWL